MAQFIAGQEFRLDGTTYRKGRPIPAEVVKKHDLKNVEKADGGEGSLEDMTVAELKAHAAENEIDLGDASKKADIIAAIEAA